MGKYVFEDESQELTTKCCLIGPCSLGLEGNILLFITIGCMLKSYEQIQVTLTGSIWEQKAVYLHLILC